jgi:hypothetical protein
VKNRWIMYVTYGLVAVAMAASPVQAGSKRKPLPVDVAVAEPVVRLCTCTAMYCQRCNTCWCYLADGGMETLKP